MSKDELSPTDLKTLGNVRGTEYLYPARMQQVTSISDVMSETAKTWGYAAVDGPTLQPVEFYSLKSSEELLQDGYYVNTSGHTYMLRPEMTPTIAYMLADAEKGLTYPVRWYADPQIYRNERPQSGRRRQFGQFNLDRFDLGPLTSEARAFADAEVIGEAIDTLSRYGLTKEDIVVRINSRSLLEKAFDVIAIDSRETRTALLGVIDAKEKLPEDVFVEKTIATGVSAGQSQQLNQWLSLGTLESIQNDQLFSALTQTDEYKELVTVFDLLGQYGFGDFATYDPIIVRGLGYYTGTVFEAFDRKPDLSMRRSILGGGRYDNFTQKFGGKLDVTGVGFGMGHIPLETVLESRKLYTLQDSVGPDYYIIAQQNDQTSQADRVAAILKLATTIRSAGKSVVIDRSINTAGDASIKKQFENASKINAKTVLILQGGDADKVSIKDQKNAEQRELLFLQLLSEFGSK